MHLPTVQHTSYLVERREKIPMSQLVQGCQARQCLGCNQEDLHRKAAIYNMVLQLYSRVPTRAQLVIMICAHNATDVPVAAIAW
jgi:hypothetical protein